MGLVGAFGGVGEDRLGPPPSAALGNGGSSFPVSWRDSSALSQLLLCLYELSFLSHPVQGNGQPLGSLLSLSYCPRAVRGPLSARTFLGSHLRARPKDFSKAAEPSPGQDGLLNFGFSSALSPLLC